MSDILQDLTDGVLTLTFNRLDKKNSFTTGMYGKLTHALARAAAEPEIKVVVFQGDVTVFSAGNDLGDFLQSSQRAASSDTSSAASDDILEQPVFDFLYALAAFPKPLLAAVCGPAVGIGTTLLLHCDLVYAGDNAAFSLPFVNLGLCPEAASSLLLPQMLGYHRAAEALLLGEPFMAEAALEVGLVNRVLPPSEAHAYTQQQARKLAAKSQTALIETKRLLKQSQMEAVGTRIDQEGQVFRRLLAGPAAREACSAFLEKRKPDFSKL